MFSHFNDYNYEPFFFVQYPKVVILQFTYTHEINCVCVNLLEIEKMKNEEHPFAHKLIRRL